MTVDIDTEAARGLLDAFSRMFSEEDHPRVTEGATSGQFTKKDQKQQSSPSTSKPSTSPQATTPKKKPRGRKVVIPKGSFGYDPASNHGTGYGVKGGDKNVHSLQQALNRLGFTDGSGKKLRDDGELGPLTTAAVKKAQRALGVPANGIVSPAFLKRLLALKTAPRPKKVAAKVRLVLADLGFGRKFNPDQPRDPDGKWGNGVGGAVAGIGVKLVREFGDGRGSVIARDDGSFEIHAKDGGRSQLRVRLTDAGDTEDLRVALEERDDASGDGWHLSWDADGANLSGDFHDDDGMRLSNDDAAALEEALQDAKVNAEFADDLSAVAPLRSGETLVEKKKFTGPNSWGDDSPLGVAVVDGPDGRTVRMAPINLLDVTGGNKELKNYSGGEGPSSAKLGESDVARLRDELSQIAAEAEVRRKAGEADENFAIDDGYFGRRAEIETPWGTLVAQGYSDELGEWNVHIGVRPREPLPDGEWELGGDIDGRELPLASLEPKEARALIRYLGSAFSAGSQK